MSHAGKGGEFSHLEAPDPTAGPPWRLRGLYAITPDHLRGAALQAACRSIIDGGARALQYRAKTAAAAQRLREASDLFRLCRQASIPLLINDDVDLARSVRAAGVHLGEDDLDIAAARQCLGTEALIGASCYDSVQRAEQALAAGADYVAFGAFFPSGSKATTRRAQLQTLHWARERNAVAVAIGGLRPDNAGPVVAAGASMLAVIGALFEADDPRAAAAEFAALFD